PGGSSTTTPELSWPPAAERASSPSPRRRCARSTSRSPARTAHRASRSSRPTVNRRTTAEPARPSPGPAGWPRRSDPPGPPPCALPGGGRRPPGTDAARGRGAAPAAGGGETPTGDRRARVRCGQPAVRGPQEGYCRCVSDLPDVETLLDAAVRALDGTRRDGQVAMARAVAEAVEAGEHLVVQAGTGTGKSLGYLVPALRHAVAENTTVVVSTATIALQNQLIGRDLPRLTEALEPLLGRRPVFAILKGRRNYLCRHRLEGAAAGPEETELFDPHLLSSLG